MSEFAQKSYENSLTLLDETRDYQSASLENERKQIASLYAFGDTVKDTLKKVYDTLEAFDSDFHKEIVKALGTITDRMIRNHKTLIDRIEEVDKFMAQRRAA